MGITRGEAMIRFKQLPVDNSDITAIAEVIKMGSLGGGYKVAQLEEEFADYIGCKYAVAVSSCTNALFLTLTHWRKYNAHSSDVTIPSMMVPLVANEIIHAGFKPYFNDDTHWVGHHFALEGTNIIDSAHSVIPNRFHFDLVTVCYSFYPTKPICGADGGMICTNDKEAADWYRKARFFGRDSGGTQVKNSWEYGQEFAGWKMNMSDVQAAIVLNQLNKHPYHDWKMTQLRKHYNKNLNLENTSNYLYRINVPERDEFIHYMKDKSVECGVHFFPLHMMDLYKQYHREDMTKVEQEYETTVSIPFHTKLAKKDMDWMCDEILTWKRQKEAAA